MNLHELFKNGSGDDLPTPTVTPRMSGDDSPWTDEQVRGIRSNPCYAGIGPYPALVPEVAWVHAAAREIKEDGVEQFLVNMLAMLRDSFDGAELNFGSDDDEQGESAKPKAVTYARAPETRGKPMSYETKFANFLNAIEEAKAVKAEMLVVAAPWVIGDTYEETIESLSQIAGTGVGLHVVHP